MHGQFLVACGLGDQKSCPLISPQQCLNVSELDWADFSPQVLTASIGELGLAVFFTGSIHNGQSQFRTIIYLSGMDMSLKILKANYSHLNPCSVRPQQ